MKLSQSENSLLFLTFNQDYSCLSVGTRKGYKIYNCDPFGKCYSKYEGGTGIVEMLFCTSLVALVGAGEQPAFSPRRLQIINTKRQSVICELSYPTTILAVKLNRRRLIVVLETQIYVYDIINMKLIHTIDTAPNTYGICALSPSSDNCYVAYPSSSNAPSIAAPNLSNAIGGDVLLFDALTLQMVNVIQAHKSNIAYIGFNQDGTLLGTASDKGTVIRVLSVPSGTKLYQFRRGSYPARICSISFNQSSTFMCVSSDTETVHIFKLQPPSMATASNGINPDASTLQKRSSLHAYLPSYLSNIPIPEVLSEILDPERNFAYLRLPNAQALGQSSGSGNIQRIQSLVAISGSAPQVIVATSDGYFYQYNINFETGGECTLSRQFSLIDSADEEAESALENSGRVEASEGTTTERDADQNPVLETEEALMISPS